MHVESDGQSLNLQNKNPSNQKNNGFLLCEFCFIQQQAAYGVHLMHKRGGKNPVLLIH